MPPQGDDLWLYDELYLRECDASLFARETAFKAKDQNVEAFLIDPNMAAHTEVGSGVRSRRPTTGSGAPGA